MESLVYLSIYHCPRLDTFPEINGEMCCLKHLTVSYTEIRELPPSIGNLSSLNYIDLQGCEDLLSLPNSLRYLTNLQELIFHGCKKLENLPENIGDLQQLRTFDAGGTAISQLPSSIGNLSGLNSLSLEGCEDLVSLPNSLRNLTNLQELILYGCKKLENLPENIGDLQQLRSLDARGTAISQLPPSIFRLGKLRSLSFSHVVQLQHSSSFVLRQLSALSSLTYLYLNNLNILGGIPEYLGSLHFLEYLNVSGSNISCLPNSIKELLCLTHLNIQFCKGLTELPGEPPPNLRMLCADYHLALKRSRDLVFKCVNLKEISISWCGHELTECRTVTSNQVNVFKFLHHFLRRSIQNDFFRQRCIRFTIPFPQGKIPEFFTYQFINQNRISVNLNPSWYTDKFMGFLICYQVHGGENYSKHTPTFFCRLSDSGLIKWLDSGNPYRLYEPPNNNPAPDMVFIYIPFQIFRDHFKTNDDCLFEVSEGSGKIGCWGVRLEYENKVRRWRRKQRVAQSPKLHPVPQKDNALRIEIGCSMVFKQQEYSSCTSSSQAFVEHNIATERGLHLYYENKDLEVDQAAMVVQKEHGSQNVELLGVCDKPLRKMDDAPRKRKRKKKRKMAGKMRTN